MPIYEYRCRACEHDFERYVAQSAAAVACPACAGTDVRRKLSLFGMKTAVVAGAAPMPGAGGGGGGGCCGGGCGCH